MLTLMQSDKTPKQRPNREIPCLSVCLRLSTGRRQSDEREHSLESFWFVLLWRKHLWVSPRWRFKPFAPFWACSLCHFLVGGGHGTRGWRRAGRWFFCTFSFFLLMHCVLFSDIFLRCKMVTWESFRLNIKIRWNLFSAPICFPTVSVVRGGGGSKWPVWSFEMWMSKEKSTPQTIQTLRNRSAFVTLVFQLWQLDFVKWRSSFYLAGFSLKIVAFSRFSFPVEERLLQLFFKFFFFTISKDHHRQQDFQLGPKNSTNLSIWLEIHMTWAGFFLFSCPLVALWHLILKKAKLVKLENGGTKDPTLIPHARDKSHTHTHT